MSSVDQLTRPKPEDRLALMALMWETFKVNRQLTYDLLNAVDGSALTRRLSRPGLDTLAKHVAEMAAVEVAFGEALASGVMDFSGVPDVFAFDDSEDAAALIAQLQAADRSVEARLAGATADVVRWDDVDIHPIVHLTNLISHEVFHQGQIALACYTLGIPLPPSWAFNWALPTQN